jgi:hypothetical protein
VCQVTSIVADLLRKIRKNNKSLKMVDFMNEMALILGNIITMDEKRKIDQQ